MITTIPTSELHADYRDEIPRLVRALLDDYPECPLEEVRLRRGGLGDRSMADADTPGAITLNAYWFSDRSLEELREAADDSYWMTVSGFGPMIRWHGGMVEPDHVVAHEFFHLLYDTIEGSADWAKERWQEATRRPQEVVTGYALAGPEEYWAEACAAAWMHVDHDQAREAGRFLHAQRKPLVPEEQR